MALQGIRWQQVVVVKEQDEAAAGFVQAAVARPAAFLTGLEPEAAETGVVQCLQPGPGVVVGCVVNDQTLPVVEGLVAYRVERLLQPRAPAVGGNDDTDDRCAVHGLRSRSAPGL